jgi:hypothetical protein
MRRSNPFGLKVVAAVLLLMVPVAGSQGFGQAPSRSITLPRGMRVEVSLLQGLSTKQSQEGEQFASVLEKDLFLDGIVVLPKGTRAIGTISRVKRPGRFRGKAEITLSFDVFRFADGREEPLVATVSRVQQVDDGTRRIGSEGEIKGPGSVGRDTGKIIAGGAAGAGIGAIAGGAKGAAIGSAAGGLIGLAGVLWTRGDELYPPARTTLEIMLETPLTLNVPTTPTAGERPPSK